MGYSVDDCEMITRGNNLAGNWQTFGSFAWFRESELSDPENWAIFTLKNRDSTLIDQSNFDIIEKEMEEFLGSEDIYNHHASHWAVGWVEGWEIRVFTDNEKKDKVTEPFAKMCELMDSMENYPVLDDSDYCEKEYEATLENIDQASWGMTIDNLPEDWREQLYTWFWDNMQEAVQSCDDLGGYPSKEEMIPALKALKFYKREEEEDAD